MLKSYSVAFKVRTAKHGQETTNRGAAQEIGVDEKRIREWRKQLPDLEAMEKPAAKKRLPGGGHASAQPGMENELIA